jgi:hypothetical protein
MKNEDGLITYDWNEPEQVVERWDHNRDAIYLSSGNSNKELIADPSAARFEDVLRALCKVVSELVEIEESKDSERF